MTIPPILHSSKSFELINHPIRESINIDIILLNRNVNKKRYIISRY